MNDAHYRFVLTVAVWLVKGIFIGLGALAAGALWRACL